MNIATHCQPWRDGKGRFKRTINELNQSDKKSQRSLSWSLTILVWMIHIQLHLSKAVMQVSISSKTIPPGHELKGSKNAPPRTITVYKNLPSGQNRESQAPPTGHNIRKFHKGPVKNVRDRSAIMECEVKFGTKILPAYSPLDIKVKQQLESGENASLYVIK